MKYIRMHQVDAEPMKRGDYNKFRGWEIPANENAEEDGYKVSYPDGYVSWCPKEQFDAAAIACTAYGDADAPKHTVPFGYAILQCVHRGKRIRRLGWNGDGQYVEFRNVEVGYSERSAFEQSTCLVFHFKNRHTGETGIQVGWLASQADLKSEDWIVDDREVV